MTLGGFVLAVPRRMKQSWGATLIRRARHVLY